MTWKQFFNIVPFSEDRQDIRNAVLCMTIYNTAGKKFKWLDMKHFLPSWMKDDVGSVIVTKSIEQQKEEFRTFVNKVTALKHRKPL